MSFFPYYNDLSPVFHLLDDYDIHRSTYPKKANHGYHCHQPALVRSFTPKFDVREFNDFYYLDGELPGVNQDNIEIEFSDPNTLVVKGRVNRNYNNNGQTNQVEHQAADDDTSSNKSLQPTVEDEDENGFASVAAPTKPAEKSVAKGNHKPAYQYRVSERSVGEFHRTFTFPTRVDQDAVKASLRNGILSLVVPKEPAPKTKKIRIE